MNLQDRTNYVVLTAGTRELVSEHEEMRDALYAAYRAVYGENERVETDFIVAMRLGEHLNPLLNVSISSNLISEMPKCAVYDSAGYVQTF